MKTYYSRLSPKGQVTIPKEVREKLDLRPGDLVAFIEKDGEIIIKKARIQV